MLDYRILVDHVHKVGLIRHFVCSLSAPDIDQGVKESKVRKTLFKK